MRRVNGLAVFAALVGLLAFGSPAASDVVVSSSTYTVESGIVSWHRGTAGFVSTGGANWGYGVTTAPSSQVNTYTGGRFVGVGCGGITGGRYDTYDHGATIGLNDGSGWKGLWDGASTTGWTQYTYSDGSIELKAPTYAHPSGLTTTISHLFYSTTPIARVWASFTNDTLVSFQV